MLFQAVFHEHIAIGQAAGIQVVQQPVTLGVEGQWLYIVVSYGPLAEEAHGAHLAVGLRKAHNVQPPPLQKWRERLAVEADEARQRTYIDISARVLPQAFGLHLGQSVLCGVAAIGQVTLYLSLCSKAQA